VTDGRHTVTRRPRRFGRREQPIAAH